MRPLFWFVFLAGTIGSSSWIVWHDLGPSWRLTYALGCAFVLGMAAGTRLAIWALKGRAQRLPVYTPEEVPR